jgi:hypothetical protein
MHWQLQLPSVLPLLTQAALCPSGQVTVVQSPQGEVPIVALSPKALMLGFVMRFTNPRSANPQMRTREDAVLPRIAGSFSTAPRRKVRRTRPEVRTCGGREPRVVEDNELDDRRQSKNLWSPKIVFVALVVVVGSCNGGAVAMIVPPQARSWNQASSNGSARLQLSLCTRIAIATPPQQGVCLHSSFRHADAAMIRAEHTWIEPSVIWIRAFTNDSNT